MHITTNSKRSWKIVYNFKALPARKVAALLLATLLVSAPSFAEKAMNYGDINDEDGKYVSWQKNAAGESLKTSLKSASPVSKAAKTTTKKLSKKDLSATHRTGYGDLDQEED
jgi:hypothetical protein